MEFEIKKGYEYFINQITFRGKNLVLVDEHEIDLEKFNSFMDKVYQKINELKDTKKYYYGIIANRINREADNFFNVTNTVINEGTSFAAILVMPLLSNFELTDEQKDILDLVDDKDSFIEKFTKVLIKAEEDYIKNNMPICLSYGTYDRTIIETEDKFISKNKTGLIEYIDKNINSMGAAKFKESKRFINNIGGFSLYKYGNLIETNTGRYVFKITNKEDANHILIRRKISYGVAKATRLSDKDIFYQKIETDHDVIKVFENDKYYIADIILSKKINKH